MEKHHKIRRFAGHTVYRVICKKRKAVVRSHKDYRLRFFGR
jgi:hypothetical protein